MSNITRDRLLLFWLAASIVLLIFLLIALKGNTRLRGKYETAMANQKALMEKNSSAEGTVRMLELTVDELKASNSGYAKQIAAYKKELSVKDKTLEQAQYMTSVSEKHDTIVFSDTIVMISDDIDTTIDDGWVRHTVRLHYPSSLIMDCSVRSEKTVLVHTRRETVEPPKRFFLARWLQKRHRVTVVDVREANPHITSGESVFVKFNR